MSRPAKDPLEIQNMFSSIAPKYDFLNRLLSFGRDIYWRRFAVSRLPEVDNAVFLDVATGTGDVAVEIVKRRSSVSKVMGVDFSEGMLELGKDKVRKLGLQEKIELRPGDATSLPFDDNTFDASIIAFGIRNLNDYARGIQEMMRVVRDEGKVVILEFTNTRNRFFRWLYYAYFTRVLPFIGEIISGKKGAYKYLPASVLDFPDAEGLKRIMEEAGLRDIKYYRLTFGIVAVHVGTKKAVYSSQLTVDSEKIKTSF